MFSYIIKANIYCAKPVQWVLLSGLTGNFSSTFAPLAKTVKVLLSMTMQCEALIKYDKANAQFAITCWCESNQSLHTLAGYQYSY